MSPLVWDLAHIANQEELWLLRNVGGREPMHPEIDPLYDAFEHPRAERPTLPLLPPAEARAYAHEVRGRVLDLLDGRDGSPGRPWLTGGFAFGMVAQHEQQHDETMLTTHQLRTGAAVLTAPAARRRRRTPRACPPRCWSPAGPFTMGTSAEPWALDNERPAHEVEVPAFYLDTTPVTNAAYQEFIADGGYDDPRWWTGDGWAHRQRAGLAAPLFWRREGQRLAAPPVRGHRAGPARRAGAARLLATRRRPTPGGRAGGCPPRRSGRRRPGSTRPPAGPGASRGATTEPAPEHANLGQRHLQPAPAGQLPGRRRAVRGAPADRRRLGVDQQRLPALPGLPGLALPGVLRGVLRPRVQGAPRRVVRGRPRWPAGAPSATGTTRSGGRSSPGSAPPGTPGRLPGPRGEPAGCAAIWLTWDHPPRCARCSRPAARPGPAVLGTAAAAVRHGERGRLRRGLVRPRRPGPGPLPPGRADLGRPVLR